MRYIYLVLVVFIFSGCTDSSSLKVSSLLQSENAKHMKNHYQNITKLLLQYKTKLDLRNPNSYDKKLDIHLRKNIKLSNNINLYSKKHKKFHYYYEYLNYAFLDDTTNRNDYLIIGLYKMFYEVYNMKKLHKITALEYDVIKFQKAYKNLQILQWKIKTKKDKHGNFLFLTWQNNWQVEYLKKLNNIKNNIKNNTKKYIFNIKDIEYLHSNKESLLDPSNSSFEIILHSMLLYMHQSIELLGAEPEQIALESFLGIAFLI